MTGRTVLAPRGFPWRSAFVGGATVAICMGIGLGVIGAASTGGAFVVSAIIGIAAFAASLG